MATYGQELERIIFFGTDDGRMEQKRSSGGRCRNRFSDFCIFKVKGWRGFLFGVGWNRSGCEYSGNCGIYCFVQLNTIYRAGSHSVYYALSGDHPINRGGILVAEKEIIWIIMIASEEDR